MQTLTNHPAVSEVLHELARAIEKFPKWPSDPLHAIAVLGEEYGELTKAVLQNVYEPHKNKDGAKDIHTEAVQTAAMALRFLLNEPYYFYRKAEQHGSSTESLITSMYGSKMGPPYYIAHPDGSFTVADPQPVMFAPTGPTGTPMAGPSTLMGRAETRTDTSSLGQNGEACKPQPTQPMPVRDALELQAFRAELMQMSEARSATTREMARMLHKNVEARVAGAKV